MKKLNYLIVLVLFAVVFFISCGGNQKDEIAVIVKTSNATFWQNVNKGAEFAIEGFSDKYEMKFFGPESESKIQEQVDMVDNAVNRGVKGIVLAPSDPDALVPSVKKAWEAGIPVVIIDSTLSDKGAEYYQSFIATDNRKAGALAAQQLIEDLGTTQGKIAIMSYVAGVGSEIGRVGGFRDYINENSSLEIIGTYYSQSDVATALNQTTDVLSANKDLVGIFGANEPTASGMGRAVKQAGLAGKIVAIGFDGDKLLQGFVKDGTLNAIAVQGSFQMGEYGVRNIIKLIDGESVAKEIDSGVIIVTKENIESPDAQGVLY